MINQFSFPVFTAFSKWCRFAMDHNLSWDIWHDKLDQAREGREKWNLYQKQTKQKFHLMMLLSTLCSSFRIEFHNRHLNQNVNLALIRFDIFYMLSIKYGMIRQNSATKISVLDHLSVWCMSGEQWLTNGHWCTVNLLLGMMCHSFPSMAPIQSCHLLIGTQMV